MLFYIDISSSNTKTVPKLSGALGASVLHILAHFRGSGQSATNDAMALVGERSVLVLFLEDGEL